jgi:hypothetical protein
MKKIMFSATIFCFAATAMAQHSPTGTMTKKRSKKSESDKYLFCMPMNEVVLLKYYDKNNHSWNEYKYPPVVFKSKDSAVYSIEEGDVAAVVNVDGMKVVIIKKEQLFYTYSNLNKVLVKKGMKVKSDQIIGYAAVDFDGVLSVDFYLNDDIKKL